MAAGRGAADRHEIAVAAELVDVGARPRDRRLDVGDVRGPRVMRCHPVVDGQAHPAEFGQVRHERVALQHATAVHPCATGHENHHGRGFGRQILAAPYIEQLRRTRAVLHRRAMDIAALLPQFPQRRHLLGRRPLDIEVLGVDDSAQRRRRHGVRAVPICALLLRIPGAKQRLRRRAEKVREVAVAPDARRGDCTKRLKVFPDHGKGSRRHAHRQHVVRRAWPSATIGRVSTSWVRGTECPVADALRDCTPQQSFQTTTFVRCLVVEIPGCFVSRITGR